MGSVKVICGAAAVLVMVGQVAQMPRERRLDLWTSAGRLLGMETRPVGVVSAQSAVATPAIVAPGLGRVETIAPDRFGQFSTAIEVEGLLLPVVVDTGAYMVCINYDEADRLGYRPLPSDFRSILNTANGQVAYAKIALREVRLGTITVRDVEALVAPRGALGRGLLGMNFLKKLSSFSTEGGRLILHQ